MNRALVSSLAILAAACGPDPKSNDVDASMVQVDAPAVDPGCPPGTGWATQAVTSTPGKASYAGQIAFAAGAMWIAFADPETGASADQDIYTTQLDDSTCTWSTPEVRHPSSMYQFAYPSLVAQGDVLHLAFSGLYDAGAESNNIYYTKRENNAWTAIEPIVTTAAGDGVGAFSPVLATSSGGDIGVVWLFAGGDINTPAEVRVAELSSAGTLQGAVTAISGANGTCDDPQLVYDAAGIRHVIATCGPFSDIRVYYTNDSGGSFATPTAIDATTGTLNSKPSLVIDADGYTLHLAWRRDISCSTTGKCAEILYSRRTSNAWSTPVEVNGGLDAKELRGSMAVDASGRIYIAFERSNAGNKSDIFVATSPDGTAFSEAMVTTGTDTTSETLPGSMIIDPAGHPHFTYVTIIGGDPFDMEVMRAELKPGGATL